MRDIAPTLYVFQEGKHRGQTIEQVFQEDPAFIWWLYNKMERQVSIRKNRLQVALEKLISQVFSLEVAKSCPYCGERKVSYLLIPATGKLQSGLSCCDDPDCRKMLRSTRPGQLARLDQHILSTIRQKEAKAFFALMKKLCRVQSLV